MTIQHQYDIVPKFQTKLATRSLSCSKKKKIENTVIREGKKRFIIIRKISSDHIIVK